MEKPRVTLVVRSVPLLFPSCAGVSERPGFSWAHVPSSADMEFQRSTSSSASEEKLEEDWRLLPLGKDGKLNQFGWLS